MKNPISELNIVKEWAQEKIQGGSEPPWAWYQYMKLIETVDAIFNGIAATTTVSSQLSEAHQETHLQLVGAKLRKDTSQRRRDKVRVHLPM